MHDFAQSSQLHNFAGEAVRKIAIALRACSLPGLQAIALRKMAGESFTLHLNDYFVEQQQGRTLDITLSYGYRDVLALEEMPDYRLVQMLVEEVFYIYDAAWCDIFWEVQNRELVRRLLNAFPVMSWAKSEVRVRPSELLPIARTSTVEWAQKDVPRLGPGTGEFSRLLPDACWYGSATGAFNVGAPRCVLPALKDAWSNEPGPTTDTVVLSFLPTQLQATAEMYDEMLRYCTSYGAYVALILPAASAHGMERWAILDRTTEGIFVEVEQKPGVFPSASPVVDHFLAALLGSPADFTAHGLAAARAAFFKGGASKLLVEARFAAALTARGYATTPAAAHELQLCLPSHVAGTPRAAEAVAALAELGLACRKL